MPFATSFKRMEAKAARATVDRFILSPGLQAFVGTSGLFASATVVGLMLGLRFLWSVFITKAGMSARVNVSLALAVGLAGVVMCKWGTGISLPNFDKLHGGAVWLMGGLMSLMFASLLLGATMADKRD